LSSISAIAALLLPAYQRFFNLNWEAYYLIEWIGNIARDQFPQCRHSMSFSAPDAAMFDLQHQLPFRRLPQAISRKDVLHVGAQVHGMDNFLHRVRVSLWLWRGVRGDGQNGCPFCSSYAAWSAPLSEAASDH
jgi:hypothetical protein